MYVSYRPKSAIRQKQNNRPWLNGQSRIRREHQRSLTTFDSNFVVGYFAGHAPIRSTTYKPLAVELRMIVEVIMESVCLCMHPELEGGKT